MYAFVQSLAISVNRSFLPRNGLSNLCGTTFRTTSSNLQPSSTVRMVGDYGITLQTLIYTPNPVISGIEDKDILCNMVWKQVFGNAYVMESEREEGYVFESMYRAGQISLKEFVRGVALTETYRRRFFECCGPYRAVELNFKHLLGRGPNSQQEVSEHVQRIANEGFEAEINSYVDSEEYDEAFGEDFVPCMRFKGTYPKIEEFNRMCAINSSPGTTDKSLTGRARATGIENPNHVLSLDGAGIPSRLVYVIATNSHSSFLKITKALPGRPDLGLGNAQSQFTAAAAQPINENATPRKRIEVSMGNYMYLTEEEAREYAGEKTEKDRLLSFAQREAAETRAQIALLQARLEELALLE